MNDLTPEQAHNQLRRYESVIEAVIAQEYAVEQLPLVYEIKLAPSYLAQYYKLRRNGNAYEIIDLDVDFDEPYVIFDRRSEQENYSAAIAWIRNELRSRGYERNAND
jgi:hypothetical protein